MKRWIAILLLCLYVGSLSGLVLATDCKTYGLQQTSLAFKNQVCLGANSHSTNTHQHPLQQFCKVLEVHKEVLAYKSKFQDNYYPSPFVTTGIFQYANGNFKLASTVLLPLANNRLFVRNSQWLI